jgi:hypothetical protein
MLQRRQESAQRKNMIQKNKKNKKKTTCKRTRIVAEVIPNNSPFCLPRSTVSSTNFVVSIKDKALGTARNRATMVLFKKKK